MKKTMLLVDDANPLLTILNKYFEKEYDVIKKTNGKEALDFILETNSIPDVVVTDIKMPIMDGGELLVALKTNPNTLNIPVVMLLSIDESSEKVKYLRLGAQDFICKPFNPEELGLRIKNILKNTAKA